MINKQEREDLEALVCCHGIEGIKSSPLIRKGYSENDLLKEARMCRTNQKNSNCQYSSSCQTCNEYNKEREQ